MWEKELNAATQELEGLRKKLDRAVEKQRKLKDRRVAAATRLKQARSEMARTRLEKAKLAYTETTAVVVELRSLSEAARARMKTAKLGLARAANRDKLAECRRAQDANRDVPVTPSPCARRQPLMPRPPCVRAASPHHRTLGAAYAALPQMA